MTISKILEIMELLLTINQKILGQIIYHYSLNEINYKKLFVNNKILKFK